jgi:tetratricopeptide (TPR) repeat protein
VVPVQRPPARTPEAAALERDIQERLARMEKEDHFALLGVGRNAGRDEIRRAYLALAKRFHPDRLAQFGLEALRPAVDQVFGRLSEAHSVLGDARRRAEYVERIDRAARGDDEKLRKIVGAEEAFVTGEIALKKRDWASAQSLFQQAVELNPEEGEHHALLGWAIFHNPKNSRTAAAAASIKRLERAIQLSPQNARAPYLLGEIYLAQNHLDRAIFCFRRALELRESHPEAERGLRLATSRREKGEGRKPEGRKGLFGRMGAGR